MAYLSPKDTTGWGYTVITDKAENPAELIKLMDFMMTPNGTRLMAWGVPIRKAIYHHHVFFGRSYSILYVDCKAWFD